MRVILLLLCLLCAAEAHEWYPVSCCGGHDCSPISPSRVVQLPDGGYMVDGKFIVKKPDVQLSMDGRYHACFYPNPDTLRCFFAPDSSV